MKLLSPLPLLILLFITSSLAHARIEYEPELRWHIDTGAAIYSAAKVDNGVVYFGNSEGKLYAVNAKSGQIQWQIDAGAPIYSQIQTSPKKLYVYTDAGNLLCLSKTDGKTLWSKTISKTEQRHSHFGPDGWDYRSSSPALDGSNIFIGSWEGSVLALDADDGELQWQFKTEAKIRSTPALTNQHLVIANYAGKIYSLNKNNGELIWEHDTDAAISKDEPHLTIINNDPLIVDDTVYIGSRNTRLYALALDSGEARWIYPLYDSWVESDLRFHKGVLYAGTSFRKAQLAFNAATGERLWQSNAANGLFYSNAAIDGSSLYVGTTAVDKLQYEGFLTDASLVKINATNGEALWQYNVNPSADRPEHGIVAPIVAIEGQLLFGSFNGRFYALEDSKNEYPINEFKVERHQLKANQGTVLSWDVEGDGQVRLNGKKVSANGRKQIQPKQSQEYTLSVDGKLTEQQTLLVEVLPTKEINLSQFANIVASSTENTMHENARYFVADNENATRWASEWKDDQWIFLDLGQQYPLDRITLNWESAFAESYTLQASMDGSEWRDFYHQEQSKGGIEEIGNLDLTARYIKLKAHKRATPYGISLYEFAVFEKE